jgi:hypothetical protein
LVLTRRELVSGQHDLALPYDLDRYTQVMKDVTRGPVDTPVSVMLKGVVRGLAGACAETVDDENLPWRSSRWSFARSLGSTVDPNIPVDVIPVRAHRLFQWMDDVIHMPVVDKITLGLSELIALDPFDNTLDVLHVYTWLELRRAERLPAQVLPVSAYFVRNSDRFRETYRQVKESGDYNGWFQFVADCLAQQSDKQVSLAQDLSRLPEELERRISPDERRDGYHRLMRMLSRFQFVNAPLVAECCGLTVKRSRELLHRAEADGIVIQIGQGRRNKNYEVVEVRNLIQRYGGVVRKADTDALRG